MKKFIAALFIIVSILSLESFTKAHAGVYILAGSGVNIPANSSTNFTNMLAQVGTFTMNAQNVYLTQSGITNTNNVFITNRLTFDGTNFFNLTNVYTFPNTNPANGLLMVVSNVSLPVYMSMSVSNGQIQIITNFGANLQY